MTSNNTYLTGKCLIAMPGLEQSFFEHSVVYICAHSSTGAMGIVLNKKLDQIDLSELLEQLDIQQAENCCNDTVMIGGPVENERGFVLHSLDYFDSNSMIIDNQYALTGTTDILRRIATKTGPREKLIVLGYSGWAARQLEQEIKENSWLTVEADTELIFGEDIDNKWQRAADKIGININMLTDRMGTA